METVKSKGATKKEEDIHANGKSVPRAFIYEDFHPKAQVNSKFLGNCSHICCYFPFT